MTHPSPGRLISTGIVLAAGTALLLSGCVRRRMTIRTSPPGATVYIDNYELGPTPRAVNFTHYGTRKIRLVKDGFETLTVSQRIPPPWYQIPPLDFVSENLVPGEIRDQRTFEYRLTPQAVVPPDELLSRAEALRRQAGTTGMFRTSTATPPGPTPAPVWSGQPGPAMPGEGPSLHTLPPGGRPAW